MPYPKQRRRHMPYQYNRKRRVYPDPKPDHDGKAEAVLAGILLLMFILSMAGVAAAVHVFLHFIT